MAAASDPPSYKQLKEDFVSNLSGGSVSEINLVVAIGPAAVLLWSVLESRQAFFSQPKSKLVSLAVDFLLNICAVLLSITLYASTPWLLAGLVLAPTLLVLTLQPNRSGSRKSKGPPTKKDKNGRQTTGALPGKESASPMLPLQPFLTQYRGCMMVLTCLAILAVDFRLFPRRFAKVETWGTSLMDSGVGSFVFSAGVVAARPVLRERVTGCTNPLAKRMLQSLRHSLPLLVLGIARTISVKGLDYAEHVTEYGVHWNFFFTLGFLPPFVALFQSGLVLLPSFAALAGLLALLYQVVLDSTGLKMYILLAPRTDFISMNREGICSFAGYLAIFLAGQNTGMHVLASCTNGTTQAHRKRLLTRLALWTMIWTCSFQLVNSPVYGASVDVSRRLANLPYVLWIAATNNGFILLFCLIDTLLISPVDPSNDKRIAREVHDQATSRVLRSMNRNGLAVFLIANVLTGLVNMAVPTLDLGPVSTMGILVAYAMAFTGVAVALDAWNIDIKL